jgi:pimeloyl-ACP methyl ester carboxylesterase
MNDGASLCGIIVVIIIVLIVLVICIVWLTNGIIFCPNRKLNMHPSEQDIECQDLYLSVERPGAIYYPGETRTEQCINVWYFDKFGTYRRGHRATTVLYFHGNSGNISHRNYVIDICQRFNLNLLLVDYRGYGKSDGTPSPENIYRDGEIAYNYLVSQIDSSEIIVWGESLGGTVACHVASKYNPRALILLATFSSLNDMIDRMVNPGVLAFGMGMTVNSFFHPMDSKRYLQNIRCPVALMHSKDDQLIPYESSKILYDSIPHSKKILFTINGGHATPDLDDETLKRLFAFTGIQAECMDHHLNYVRQTLAEATKDNPGLVPEGFMGVI